MGIVNRISEAEQERVGLFSEEMGEAQVEIGKILRHGIDSCHPDEPGLSNAQRLELEAGHVLAAIDLLVVSGTLNLGALAQHRRQKLEKLKSWLHCGTNLDAVDELLKDRYLLKGADAKEFIGSVRDMVVAARAEYRRLAEPLLHGESEVVQAFSTSLEAAIGECSPEQAIDDLRRFMIEQREADVAFACGKCGGRWAFAPSALREGWPPVDSGCCGSGAWIKP